MSARPAVDFGLSPAEVKVVIPLVEGKTNQQIARELWLSEQTIKYHLSNIYPKLKAKNRVHAVAILIRNGW